MTDETKYSVSSGRCKGDGERPAGPRATSKRGMPARFRSELDNVFSNVGKALGDRPRCEVRF